MRRLGFLGLIVVCLSATLGASAVTPGEVIVAWQQTVTPDPGPRIERYSSSGTLLSSFFATLPATGTSIAGLGVSPGGDIIVAWQQTVTPDPGPRIERYSSSGTLLSSFFATLPATGTSIAGLGVSPGGDIIVAWQQTVTPDPGPRIERYSSSGTLLSSFFATLPATGTSIAGLGVSPGGDIIVAWQQTVTPDPGPRIERYSSSGTLLSSFFATLPATGTSIAGLGVSPGGDIIVAWQQTVTPDPGPRIERYSSSGTLLSSFFATLPATGTSIAELDVVPGGQCGNGVLEVGEDCDDGNQAGGDCCSSSCNFESSGAVCDDGNACTTGASCNGAGVCGAGSPIICDDANICTDNSCNPASGCVFTPNVAPCEDGDACTTSDVCSGGSCVGGAPLICDDTNLCTDDSCSPASGCVFTPNLAPCEDGNACTTSDVCSAGTCLGGTPLMCDDTNLCTDDICNPISGCIFTPNTDPCDDGLFCNGVDTCGGGSCVSSGDPCAGSDGDANCAESCDEGADDCTAPDPEGSLCVDADLCTISESCLSGLCQGAALDCDDGDLCTAESCDALDGCVSVPIAGCGIPFDITSVVTGSGGTAAGTSSGVDWSLSPTFIFAGRVVADGTSSLFSDSAFHDPPLSNSDVLHIGLESFSLTFGETVESVFVYLADNGAPDGELDFGLIPTVISGQIAVNGTRFAPASEFGGLVRLDGIDSTVLSHTATGASGGLDFAVVVTAPQTAAEINYSVQSGATCSLVVTNGSTSGVCDDVRDDDIATGLGISDDSSGMPLLVEIDVTFAETAPRITRVESVHHLEALDGSWTISLNTNGAWQDVLTGGPTGNTTFVQPVNLPLVTAVRYESTCSPNCGTGIFELRAFGPEAQTCAPPTGAIAWWTGDGNTNDVVGGRNATLENGAGIDSGQVNQAFRLDGSSDFLSVPDDPIWTFGSDFTVSLWVNFDTVRFGSPGNLPNVFVGHDDGGGGTEKWVFFHDGGRPGFHINGSGGSVFLASLSPFSATLGQWHHFAVTRNGDTYTFFADGQDLGSVADSRAIPNASANLSMGQAEDRGYLDGRLDEIQLFDRALTASEVAAIASCGFIPVANPSFEDPVLGDGIFTQNSVPGWTLTGFAGVFNPSIDAYPLGAAAEGQNVAWGHAAEISQTLAATLTADTTYTLEVVIGDPANVGGFPGYRVELRAGGSLLAADDDMLTPGAGGFSDSTVSYTALAGDPSLGGSLSIHLISFGEEVNFDDVRLNVVPEPRALLSLAAGVGMLFMLHRRRQRPSRDWVARTNDLGSIRT